MKTDAKTKIKIKIRATHLWQVEILKRRKRVILKIELYPK